jgi:HEAT repeat protein
MSGEPSSASVLEGLASGDLRIRAQAISDLRRTAVTGDMLPVVAPLVDPSASTNLGERAILIDHLGTLNSDDAAALLERVARDRSQSEPVRNAAVLALARMDPRVAGAPLQTLATSLEDGTLKELAELLAE